MLSPYIPRLYIPRLNFLFPWFMYKLNIGAYHNCSNLELETDQELNILVEQLKIETSGQ